MQIIPQDEQLVFISEDPATDEENKVQSFKWVDIKTISFIYPPKSVWQTMKAVFVAIFSFFIDAGGDSISSALSKPITIAIGLKSGKKESFEFRANSVKYAQTLEQEFLKYLKTADARLT